MIQQLKVIGVISELLKEKPMNAKQLANELQYFDMHYTGAEVKGMVAILTDIYNAPIYKHQKFLSFNWSYRYRKGSQYNFFKEVIYKVHEALFDTMELLEHEQETEV